MHVVYNKNAQYDNGPLYIKRPITQKKNTHSKTFSPKTCHYHQQQQRNIKMKIPEIPIH
jgi:hypothetical protein